MSPNTTLSSAGRRVLAALQEAEKSEVLISELLDRHPVPVSAVFDELAALPWHARWPILERLARTGPTLGGMTYLEILHEAAQEEPNLNVAVRTAIESELLGRGGRTLALDRVAAATTLATQLALCPGADQLEISAHMGIKGQEADGYMATAFAAAVELGLLPAPPGMLADIAGIPFGDYDRPGGEPHNLYMGKAIHAAIAAYYMRAHPHPPPAVLASNYTPLPTVVAEIAAVVPAADAAILTAELETEEKPDIFEIAYAAHPGMPATVYEIKSSAGALKAAREAEYYAEMFRCANVPCLPGPAGFPGTFGTLPAPNGWVRFSVTAPGALIYDYLRAPQVEIDARDEQRGRGRRQREFVAALENAGVPAATAGLVAALLLALKEVGWLIAFA